MLLPTEYRLIALDKGKVAKVSPEDYEWLSRIKWTAKQNRPTSPWYAVCDLNCAGHRLRLRMHRVIIGVRSDELIDHIDGDGLNNQRSNLRKCTPSQNQAHGNGPRSHNKSRIRGVHWSQDRRKWVAQIKMNGKTDISRKIQH